ncbi:MAG: aminopeptidase [Pseudomonadales bacterium]|nr:aminopeptidase [Pseudomonadales bacterium]
MNNQAHKHLATLILSLLLCGCESVSYYYQAVEGQLNILSLREPIEEVIKEDDISDLKKQKLDLVLEVRKFAQQSLALEVDDHYSQYVELNRPYVVWNVFAAPEFSIKPKTWCFPIAGCVAYKGYFEEKHARQQADKLDNEGYDTYVGGVAAYSTLGWFEDPVLNTFLSRSDPGLVALLIHELAHQELYVEDDSAFNESFATTVEILGLNEWLRQQNQADQISKMADHRKRKAEFIDLILSHRKSLAALYETELPEEQRRAEKANAKTALLNQYQELKQSWQGYNGYDRWFEGPLNNAQLSTIGTYHQWVDAFMVVFHQQDRDWPRFYDKCREIAQLNREVRDQTLEKLSVEAANYRL